MRIPKLGVGCKKWVSWTPIASVLRNPSPHENLRLLATPQPWC